MPVIIAPERPDTPDAITLITELQDGLAQLYPVESQHGLNIDQLIKQNVAFYVARVDGVPAACGGIKLFGSEYGELKRMYVRPQYRGQGLAKLLISTLEAHARDHGVTTVRLETGIHQTEAIGLYERAGYHSRGRFGDYEDDPNSLFYEKQIG